MTTDTYPKTIKEFLIHIARYGAKPALANYQDNNQLTYEQLVGKVLVVATNLKANNSLKVGDRVVLHDLFGTDWAIVFFACLLDGYVAIPIDTRMSTELVEDLLISTTPKLIVSGKKTTIKTNIRKKLVNELLMTQPKAAVLNDFEALNRNTIAEIILTSGTWSQPKGVTLTHKNILSNLAGVDTAYKLASQAKLLSILPLSHAYEQMVGLFVPLYQGASIIYVPQIRADILTAAIKECGITTLVAVPRILDLLRKGVLKKIPRSKRPIFEKLVLASRIMPIWARRKLFGKVHESLGNSLKTLIIGGAPLEQPLDYFFQGLGYTVLVGYGLSETAPVLSVSVNQKRISGNVGMPLNNVLLKINTEGEVIASGDNVFYGYWPTKNSTTSFNTGDLGRLDKQGNLILIGRTKNLVIFPSGDKIFLEDIENLADQTDGIQESCAANIGNDTHPHVHLFVITKNKNLDDFVQTINQKLPFGVRIQSISKVDTNSLPRTHTLKLSRQSIIDNYSKNISKPTN